MKPGDLGSFEKPGVIPAECLGAVAEPLHTPGAKLGGVNNPDSTLEQLERRPGSQEVWEEVQPGKGFCSGAPKERQEMPG